MSCLQLLRRHTLRLAAAALVIAPSAPVLAADCAQWNVAGKHAIYQSNAAYSEMILQQDGTQFKGSISVWASPYFADGDIVGTVVGSNFEATVYWHGGSSVGIYSGQIGPQGLAVGRTFDKNNPASSADWNGSPAFNCLTKAAPNAAGSSAGSGNDRKPPLALGRTKAPASPNIAEPREGGTYPPRTPLRVRIVPAKDAKDTAYRIEIQRKVNSYWRDLITVATPAGVGQSPQGYRDWGAQAPGDRAEMAATAGAYRMRARSTAPQMGEPGEWVQFKIDGQPGKQVDAMNQATTAPAPAAGAAAAAASRVGGQTGIPNALGNAPAAAVTLNPQSLAPKSLSGAASLNPQPLPPKTAPGSLTAAPLPGAVPQAPSSLR
jgi:hypothetical protein